MSSVNKVIIVGNCTRDPEVRRMPSGGVVVSLGIATSDRWTDKQTGGRKEKTEFHNVVIFNDQIAKVAEQYLKKGMKVYVEGSLQTRSWEDQSGVKKYTTEVVLQKFRGELTMLDSGGERQETAPKQAPKQESYGSASGANGAHPDLDDDLPF